MRVAYLASPFLQPDNPRSWSGLPYFMHRTLQDAGLDVTILHPGKEKAAVERWLRFLAWRARGRRYLRYCNERLLRGYARDFERLLRAAPADAVFSPSTWMLAYLDTRAPMVFWTDACFAGIIDFYEAFTRLAPPSLREGHAAEQRALSRCARAIYASQWAIDGATRAYAFDPAKISLIPFGANLENPPTLDEAAELVRARSAQRCELLWMGVDWKRKNADLAVQVARELNAAGVDAHLTVVGCNPPDPRALPPCVTSIPFIGKDTAEGRQRIRELFARSHFFIMPTRAEAFGIVFAEAGAFGVPSVATNVGGLPSVITNDVNGRLFPLDAPASAYAGYIASVFRQPGRYRELALGAACEAATRLSWKVSARKIAALFASLEGPADSPRRRQLEPAAP